MAHGVLPALVGAAEEREALLEERVDFAEGETFGWGVLDGHDDEGYVGVGWFFLAADAGFLVGAGGFGVGFLVGAFGGDVLLLLLWLFEW